jgi:hypothetical protein
VTISLIVRLNLQILQHPLLILRIVQKGLIQLLIQTMVQVHMMMAEGLEMIQSSINLVFVVILKYLQVLDQQTTTQILQSNLHILQHLLLVLKTVQKDLIQQSIQTTVLVHTMMEKSSVMIQSHI